MYWPRGNRVAKIREGGEIAGINGFMHEIDNVLIYEPDIKARACQAAFLDYLLIFCILVALYRNRMAEIIFLLSYKYLLSDFVN